MQPMRFLISCLLSNILWNFCFANLMDKKQYVFKIFKLFKNYFLWMCFWFDCPFLLSTWKRLFLVESYIILICSAMLSCFSCVRLFAIPWTIAHPVPLCMGFSRQEYWSGLPFPSLIKSLYTLIFVC